MMKIVNGYPAKKSGRPKAALKLKAEKRFRPAPGFLRP
jgi:hypothetical protein